MIGGRRDGNIYLSSRTRDLRIFCRELSAIETHGWDLMQSPAHYTAKVDKSVGNASSRALIAKFLEKTMLMSHYTNNFSSLRPNHCQYPCDISMRPGGEAFSPVSRGCAIQNSSLTSHTRITMYRKPSLHPRSDRLSNMRMLKSELVADRKR